MIKPVRTFLRKRKISQIEKLASKDDVVNLINMAEHERVDWELRNMISGRLAKMGAEVIPALVEKLGEVNWPSRNCIALALEKLKWKPTSKSEQILYLLATMNRRSSIRHLTQLRGPELIDNMLPLICDPAVSNNIDDLLMETIDSTCMEQLALAVGKSLCSRAKEMIEEYLSMMSAGILCHEAKRSLRKAKNWWHKQSTRRAEAKCDKCSRIISRYCGYLVEPGSTLSIGERVIMGGPNLLCEICYKRYHAVQALSLDLHTLSFLQTGEEAFLVQERAAKQLAAFNFDDVIDLGKAHFELERAGFDPDTGEKQKA